MQNFISAQCHRRHILQWSKVPTLLFKHSLQRMVLTLVLLVTLPFFSNIAYCFEQDGIAYNILSEDELTVEVTQREAKYKGDIVIPSQVTYEAKTYSVTAIGDYAFEDCQNLASVVIPNTTKIIGADAFGYCNSLTSVDIPASVTKINFTAFNFCSNLENINVAEDNQVFSSIDGVLYNRDATEILSCPNSRTELTIQNSVEVIGWGAFYGCKFLSSVIIPDTVKEINGYAFSCCESLKSVIIPPLVKSLEQYTFEWCHSLESVILPEALASINLADFASCTSLKEIQIKNPVPFECREEFSEAVLSNAILYVPIGSAEAYQQVEPWKNFVNIREMDFSGIEEIVNNQDNEIHLSFSNGALNIVGLNGMTNISIYDLSGNVVYKGMGHIVNGLDKGVYFIKIGNKTIKTIL